MKKIPLTRGKYTLVDDADFERLNQWKWYAKKDGNTIYAARMSSRVGGKQSLILMHREILGLEPGDKRQGDHRNHNGLDNWRDNLRICTNPQNQHNRSPHRNGTSVFKGVYWCKERRRWRTQIRFNGHLIHLGYFDSEIDAANLYDKTAKEYFKEYAFTNF